MVKLKASVVTVSYNSSGTISDTIKSVLSQAYPNIEFIIVDGSSTDGTFDIIKSFGSKVSKFISEPDKGIYDAINKGIRLASGDIVGILNSDDFFYNNDVIQTVAKTFQEDSKIEAIFGDIVFVDRARTSKIMRYYSSEKFSPEKFKFGFMPAHPSFYAKRELFERFGYYKTDYKIAADFELLVRFLYINHIRYKYLPMPFVSMRRGGISNRSVLSNITLNREILRACKENGIKTNYFNIYSKYFTKIFEFMGNNNAHIRI
jgi:glycosyltransferase involved in cell wall biosynthesis